jgi:hypothetical protein
MLSTWHYYGKYQVKYQAGKERNYLGRWCYQLGFLEKDAKSLNSISCQEMIGFL